MTVTDIRATIVAAALAEHEKMVWTDDANGVVACRGNAGWPGCGWSTADRHGYFALFAAHQADSVLARPGR